VSGLGWLDGIFGSVRCANCEAAYDRTDVNVVGNRNEYWFLRCVCHTCGTQGVGTVVVKEFQLALPTGSRVEESFVGIRCANCGASYSQGDLRFVGNRNEYWFLRCSCHVCGNQAVAVGVVSEVSPAAASFELPLQVNDVLNAHELLENFHGGVQALFAGGEKKDPWKELLDEHKDDPQWKL